MRPSQLLLFPAIGTIALLSGCSGSDAPPTSQTRPIATADEAVAFFDDPILHSDDPPTGTPYRDWANQYNAAYLKKVDAVRAAISTEPKCKRYLENVNGAVERGQSDSLTSHMIDIQIQFAFDNKCLVLPGVSVASSTTAASPPPKPSRQLQPFVVVLAGTPVCGSYQDAIRVTAVVNMKNENALHAILDKTQCELVASEVPVKQEGMRELEYGVGTVTLKTGTFYFPMSRTEVRALTEADIAQMAGSAAQN